MNIYADTSWWLAYKSRGSLHHDSAVAFFFFDREPRARILWTPWHRLEVFNSFRQAEFAGLIARGEARAMIRLLEQEIRLGYWPHVEFDWTETGGTRLRTERGTLSSREGAEHGFISCRGRGRNRR